MAANSTTSMALSARVTVQNQPVVLNASDLSKGIVFTLTQPTTLGSPQDFVDWISTTFNVSPALKLDTIAKSIPAPLDGAFAKFVGGTVTLDTLIINQPLSQYQLGVSYTIDPGISLIAGLAFNGIGVLITHQVPVTKLTAAVDDKVQSLTVTTGDGAQFTPPQGKTLNIKVDNEIMTISIVSGDTLTVTRAALGSKAALHASGATVVLNS